MHLLSLHMLQGGDDVYHVMATPDMITVPDPEILQVEFLDPPSWWFER